MTSVTAENAERIRDYVLDCSIRRFTSLETAEYLKQKGFPVTVRTVKRYRAKIRASAQDWVASLAKSKRLEYIFEYMSRIQEIQKCQRELWNIVYDKQTFPRVKVEAIGRVLECSQHLVELYDCMPLINALRDYGCGYDHDKDKDLLQQQQQDYDSTDIGKTPFRSGSDSNWTSSG